MATIKKFEKLEVWKAVRELVNLIYQHSKLPEFSKDFALRDQEIKAKMIDSSQKLPNSKNCFACGMENPIGLKLEMYANPDGEGVVCDYTIPKIYEGYPNIAHGGIVTTLLDEVISRVYMREDPNRFMYTAKLTTKYRKHVPVETPLHMIGEWIKDRGRTAEAKAAIYGPNGELLAEGEALLIALPPDDLNAVDLQELGWRVYPD